LRTVTEAVGVPVVVHCCAAGVPIKVLTDGGAAAVAIDLGFLQDLDPLGEAIEAGIGLFAGAVPTLPPSDGRAPSSQKIADRVRKVWDRLSFPAERLADQIVVTPACGLAGASESYVRAVLTGCREAGRRLAEV
jgi:methionine synthase II (cobalamin-independent)